MKLNKKFLACFMAATMAIAPMTAFGDTASSEITGEGEVSILDTEVYNVILPTADSIGFKVDPYGLLSIDGTDTLENVVSNAAGTVTSSATAIINKSSVDISVKVSSYLTASGATLNLATSRAEAVSGTKDLYLEITQVSGAAVTMAASVVTAEANGITGDAALVDDVYVISGAGLDITGGALVATGEAVTSLTSSAMSSFDVDLTNVADAYEVTSRGAVTISEGAVTYDDNNTYVFAITGYANPDSEAWAKLAEDGAELKLNMKFDITAGEAGAASDPFANLTVTKGSTSNLVIPTTQKVTKLVLVSAAGVAKNATLSSTQYTATASNLTILGSWMKGFATAGDYVFTATFADSTTKTFTIKCQ